MKLRRSVYVVGGAHTVYLGKGHPDFVREPSDERRNPTLEEHLHRAIRALLTDTGVDAAAIDKGYVGNFCGELFAAQGHLGAMAAAAHPGLAGKPWARVEGACASGGLAVTACIDALQGFADVALAAGVEVETTAPGKVVADYIARASHYQTQGRLSRQVFPHLFARRARHYKEAFGATDEDLGRVVVKAYENAHHNPYAQMRAVPMDLHSATYPSERNPHFVDDPAYRAHLKFSDCSQVTDGASAVLLATAEGLQRLGIARADTVEILSYGHAVSPLGAETDPRCLQNAAAAAAEALRDAGVSAGELEVAEVHDCFSITELQLYEALGLAPLGGGAALLREGVTTRAGRVPVNPGGGLIGWGHPVGATGVRMVAEMHRQMKGRCAGYQLARLPRLGVTANIGGDDRTAVVMVHRSAEA